MEYFDIFCVVYSVCLWLLVSFDEEVMIIRVMIIIYFKTFHLMY